MPEEQVDQLGEVDFFCDYLAVIKQKYYPEHGLKNGSKNLLVTNEDKQASQELLPCNEVPDEPRTDRTRCSTSPNRDSNRTVSGKENSTEKQATRKIVALLSNRKNLFLIKQLSANNQSLTPDPREYVLVSYRLVWYDGKT